MQHQCCLDKRPSPDDRHQAPTGPAARTAAIVVGVLSTMAVAGHALAQDAGEGAAPGGGGGNVVVTQSFPWGGLILTMVMAGLCLFAICRSSRRN